MSSETVDLAINPKEYFRERVNDAARKYNISVSEDIEFYLVNLLYDFISPTKIVTALGNESILDTPLAFIQEKALAAPAEERIKIFKSLGDASLYICGYFEGFFNRKAVTIDYFITLGSNAYSSVSDLIQEREQSPHFRNLYSTLSSNFKQYVEIYAEVGSFTNNQDNQNILATYDKWLSNGSERLRRQLEDHGIIPIDAAKKNQQ